MPYLFNALPKSWRPMPYGLESNHCPSKGGGSIVVMVRRPLGGGFMMPPALRVEHRCTNAIASRKW